MTEDQNRTLQDKFMLRLPDGMRERVREAAEQNKRSMNAEIIARLEASFSPATDQGGITVPRHEWLKMLHEIERFAEGAEKIIEAGRVISTKHKSESEKR
ncbi:Arc family DNA-binding protein [Ochrobactrum sp. A-1]|uniref:Arc family DNA-binding protein n=1 Tax=Ochrobactrum sp. A-1 TaxID=2920940 RepID=UPI0023E8B6C3